MVSSTGVSIERRTDGTIVKHVSVDGPAALLVGGADRVARLWKSGVFHRLPPQLDSAIIDVTPTGDGWDVVMHDVGPWLLEHRPAIDAAETCRILDAVATAHATFDGFTLDGLCPLPVWLTFLAPESIQKLRGVLPIAQVILDGWDRFFATAPEPAAEAIRTIHTDASALAASLTAEGTTLLQGDFWWHNLALPTDRVVLLDWGELTTTGPAALAVVQWLAHDADKLPWSHDRFLDEAAATHARSGSRITAPSIDLAVLAVVAQMGWSRAGAFDFQWWTDRLEAALPTARSGDIL